MDWMLIGKAPSEPDFIRINATALGVELWGWLSEATAALGPAIGGLPAQGVRFAFRGAQPGERALLGVLVPSQDAVGRRFPLVAATEVALRDSRVGWPLLPMAWNPTFLATRRVLEAATSHGTASLIQRLASVEPPSPDAISDAMQRASLAIERPASDFHVRLFGPDPADAHYAYQAVRAAVSSPSLAAPTISCPVMQPADVAIWLELVRRLTGIAPSWFWPGQSPTQLLVAFAAPPHAVLGMLAAAYADHSHIWPLTTTSAVARQRASGAVGALPTPDAPLRCTLNALAGMTL